MLYFATFSCSFVKVDVFVVVVVFLQEEVNGSHSFSSKLVEL